jgi:hypothetical protein
MKEFYLQRLWRFLEGKYFFCENSLLPVAPRTAAISLMQVQQFRYDTLAPEFPKIPYLNIYTSRVHKIDLFLVFKGLISSG